MTSYETPASEKRFSCYEIPPSPPYLSLQKAVPASSSIQSLNYSSKWLRITLQICVSFRYFSFLALFLIESTLWS
ncbi:hypothetical protein SLEP1_g59639 [Rubroshorea leprosula]|uniref:Uncharacterized protein n=1 Tax=Rubroshorea leprosula TaxID=152421 RepID=A0AAV5MU16_9ROSI|nr:hypothetical protein SLEP1_g59639 [Rubroshorea leprosula]